VKGRSRNTALVLLTPSLEAESRDALEDELVRRIVDEEVDENRPRLPPMVQKRFSKFRRLGRGGSATVWQARDASLDRDVALKVFDVGNPSAADVFREGHSLSKVVGDHAVKVLESIEGPPHVLVLELVVGYDPIAKKHRTGFTAVNCRAGDFRKTIEWNVSVARGVQDAHNADVCHCDLKPSNVMIVPGKLSAKVADFGLGVLGGGRRGTADESYVSESGEGTTRIRIAGTPAYMAPEQAAGLPVGLSMEASGDRERLIAIDVFGLGALAFDLISGRSPYGDPTPTSDGANVDAARSAVSLLEICDRAQKCARPRLDTLRDYRGRRISRRLSKIVEKAMAPRPEDRYPSADAVANEMQAWLDNRPSSLDGVPTRVMLAGRRNPGIVALMIAAVAFGGVIASEIAEARHLKHENTESAAAITAANQRRSAAEAEAKAAENGRDQAKVDLKNTQDRAAAAAELYQQQYAGKDQEAISAKKAERDERARRGMAENERDTAKRERDDEKTKREAADKLRTTAEQDRDSEKAKREAADKLRTTAEQDRDSEKAKREAADKLRTSAEQDRDSEKAKREAADKLRTSAEQDRDNEKKKRETAEQDRDSEKKKREAVEKELAEERAKKAATPDTAKTGGDAPVPPVTTTSP
jgi:serine/threonine protein kinase